MRKSRINCQNLSVRLSLNETREPITSAAANARALVRSFLIEHDTKRRVERLQPKPREIFRELLKARLMAHRRMRIWATGGRLGGVLPPLAMHVILVLRLVVVRL